jgi:hypothetical protein
MTRYAHSAALDEQLRRERMADEAWREWAMRGTTLAARDEFLERFMLQFPPIRWPERDSAKD